MRRALLCACNEYRDPAFAPLKYPLNDVEEIRHLLEEPELCGFEDIELLANPGRGDAHEAVEHLTADSSHEDLILFYFSGHGKLAQDGSVSLVLNDTKENRLHSTGLLDDQLRILFNASRARQRVIILDCCYSGAVGEEGFKRASDDAVETMAHQIKGTFILTASTKFQPAMECAETRGSAFTSCLIEGVRSGAAAEKDTGCVTLAKLGEYLAREVPLRSNQQPKFWDFGGVGGTVIAHVPSRFDTKWTEQTLKRLRQMMAREQIDDTLFVELQRVLRSPSDDVGQDRLALIDDLAQRRMKPVPFLRKWQAFRPDEEAEIEAEKRQREKLKQETLERERLEQEKLERARLEQERLGWERLERDRLERERLEREKLEWERLHQEKLERERRRTTDRDPIEVARTYQPQPPPNEPPVDSGSDHPTDEQSYQAGRPDPEDWSMSVEEAVDEPETEPPSVRAMALEFLLIAASLAFAAGLLTINDYALDDDGTWAIIGAFLLIIVWIRLWLRISGGPGKFFLSGSILICSYVGANLARYDIYSFFRVQGVVLAAFTLVLATLIFRARRSREQTP